MMYPWVYISYIVCIFMHRVDSIAHPLNSMAIGRMYPFFGDLHAPTCPHQIAFAARVVRALARANGLW